MRSWLKNMRWSALVGLQVALVGCQQGSAKPEAAAPSEGQEQPAAQGPACGKIACAVGEVCCNASCSICTPPDGMCTQQVCEADSVSGAPGPQGGANAPSPGEITPPVEGAIDGAPTDNAPTCADTSCPQGTHCEMVQVQCVRAPCNPVPECRPNTAPAR